MGRFTKDKRRSLRLGYWQPDARTVGSPNALGWRKLRIRNNLTILVYETSVPSVPQDGFPFISCVDAPLFLPAPSQVSLLNEMALPLPLHAADTGNTLPHRYPSHATPHPSRIVHHILSLVRTRLGIEPITPNLSLSLRRTTYFIFARTYFQRNPTIFLFCSLGTRVTCEYVTLTLILKILPGRPLTCRRHRDRLQSTYKLTKAPARNCSSANSIKVLHHTALKFRTGFSGSPMY